MQRMTGCDATFIYDDRPDEPQHTLKVCILGSAASERFSLAGMRDWVAERLPALPPLRWLAVRVPFDLHHPVWVEAPKIDLGYHVKHAALPAPGSRLELCDAISELAGNQLDPDRPLWQLWLFEGYEQDRVVAVLKLSHALGDGDASRRLLEGLFAQEVPAPPCTAPAGLPSPWSLLRDALRDRMRDLFVHPARMWSALVRVRASLAEARREDRLPSASPNIFAAPTTPFTGSLSRRRAFHFTTLSLDAAKHVRRTLDCTLNDVVLGTAAGAMRRYLFEHGALPGVPTVAMMPASTRKAGCTEWNNQFTVRGIEFPTQESDPIAQVMAVARATQNAKRDLALRAGTNFEDWLSWLPPFLPKTISRLMRTLVRVMPKPPGSICVSNVRGPRETLMAPGGPIETLISVGHMKYMAGLNLTVWSYRDQLNVGLYTDAEVAPDLWRVSGCVNEAFEELCKAAAREDARVAA
jgi:WS/DGAT/MGAT family acyltransferase